MSCTEAVFNCRKERRFWVPSTFWSREWPSPSEVDVAAQARWNWWKKSCWAAEMAGSNMVQLLLWLPKKIRRGCLRQNPDLLLQTGIGGTFRDVNLYYLYIYIYTHNSIGESKNGSVEHCKKYSPLRTSQDVLRVGGRGRPERIFTGRTTRFLGISPNMGIIPKSSGESCPYVPMRIWV